MTYKNGETIRPSRLSLFAQDNKNGNPLPNQLVYAEVGVPYDPPVLIDNRLLEPIRVALQHSDAICAGDTNCRDRVEEVLLTALSKLFSLDMRNLFAQVQEKARSLVTKGLESVREKSGTPLSEITTDKLEQLVQESIIEAANALGYAIIENSEHGITWAHSLGVLSTDYMGYLSFDLLNLPAYIYELVIEAIELRKTDPMAKRKIGIWLYPLDQPENRFDALEQGRFTTETIVVRLVIGNHALPSVLKNMGILSMQNPGLPDWRLSPSSFAANPKTLLGENGCENLFPSNLAMQEFYFSQLVGFTDIKPKINTDYASKVKFGVVYEYRLAWHPLGHSLGQILYSLPLAPGESINLAIIDWVRQDSAQRSETTTVDESLVHEQRRDRAISETVEASLEEWQRGGSIMGGVAASYGTGGFGASGAVGGAYSTSSGNRDIAADTAQKVGDIVSQKSASTRELHSTIVVQSTQTETEKVETRTFVNYNHSHTLTILYYEVLRHYRVAIELVRRRPVALVKMDDKWKSCLNQEVVGSDGPDLRLNAKHAESLLRLRPVLEPALLDPQYKEGFNALQRIVHQNKIESVKKFLNIKDPDRGKTEFVLFDIHMQTGGNFDPNATLYGVIYKDAKSGLTELKNTTHAFDKDDPSNTRLGQYGQFHYSEYDNTFFVVPGQDTVKWDDIFAFGLQLSTPNSDLSIQKVLIFGYTNDGVKEMLVDWSGDKIFRPSATTTLYLPILRPPVTPPVQPDVEDYVKRAELLDHLVDKQDYYNRILSIASTPDERAVMLDNIKISNDSSATLFEKIENRPIGYLGNFIAYPLTDHEWIESIEEAMNKGTAPDPKPDERLVTLPTRGVFGEAKLGHCNASEEIDNTRFWDWQQSPIPHLAPEIAPTQTVTPQPQSMNLSPTSFPASMINIVSPPSAPDPTGLASALTALATPNIFRDMSGRTEVADLLKQLSTNSIEIQEAAAKAKEIQNKYGENLSATAPVTTPSRSSTTDPVADQRIAQAQATKAETEVEQAQVENAKSRAQAAVQTLPPSKRGPALDTAAQTLAGNPIKEKTIVFKTQGFDGQVIPGELFLTVHDVVQADDVIKGEKVGINNNGYFSKKVTFPDAEPILDAKVVRVATVPIVILDETFSLPAINIHNKDGSYPVGRNHRVINLTLTQAPLPVTFKAKSTNAAVDELMQKTGGELGINKVVAAKIVADYEQKNQITHGNEEEKSYTFNFPSQNYELKFSSQ
ncbi:hypothetical protein ACFQZR_21055 [Paenibacillus sp. GCM10027629]|uniref:hypothetical protein n=1 Tax=Paenibacillus sp. GCM10027629 TaxID=3273414 RepID=UPI003626C059